MASPYVKRGKGRRRIGDSRNRLSIAATASSKASIKMSIPRGENFASCYMELCKEQRVRPLPVICVTLPQCLDFTTDRVKMDDWGPILNSLTLDRSLRSISVRSRYQCRKPLEEINSEDKVRAMLGKAPVVLSRYLLEWLSHSVGQCVTNSPVLTYLELEGIPFPADCLATLCVGLANTESLQHLSLQRCYIGDNSCELVCRTVADVQSIRTLNLSQCDLSGNCGACLAAALSRQKLSLYHETWQQSLRYREPNLDAMPGLRRLTLNGNPRLGDLAVFELIEAIRDSLWLKAVDLQHCGLTNRTGQEIIQLLDNNKTLSVIDVRMNSNLQENLMNEIFRKLEMNNAENGRSDYRWLSLPPQRENRNVVCADARGRNRYYYDDELNNDATLIKPKSAFAPKTRRPAGAGRNLSVKGNVVNRRSRSDAPTRSSQVNKIAIRTDVRPDASKLKKPGEDPPPGIKEKLSLRVDLCAQMQVDEPIPSPGEISKHEDAVTIGEEEEEDESLKCPSRESNSAQELNRVLEQLSEARMEHDRLMEESRRAGTLLAEEKCRRESAETKLELMKRDLADLEGTLRETESETRGFLLISQRSLDDMAESFDRVLEMLDHLARNSRAANVRYLEEQGDQDEEQHQDQVIHARQDYSRAKAEIRKRVARLIRKTKSESHRGGLLRVECEETRVIDAASSSSSSSEAVDTSTKKLAKSEGDVRSLLPPPILQPIRLEKNIGDSPNVISTGLARPTNYRVWPECHQMLDYNNKTASPCERARALFAEILNGESFIHGLGAHAS